MRISAFFKKTHIFVKHFLLETGVLFDAKFFFIRLSLRRRWAVLVNGKHRKPREKNADLADTDVGFEQLKFSGKSWKRLIIFFRAGRIFSEKCSTDLQNSFQGPVEKHIRIALASFFRCFFWVFCFRKIAEKHQKHMFFWDSE